MSDTAAGSAAPRLALARSLMADVAAAELSTAFAERGVESVLLKGPALVELLYPGGGQRTYTDADLLVEPVRLATARRVLEERGFALAEEQMPPSGQTVHAEPWHRQADGASVDLHRSLFGCGVDPYAVWPVATAGTEELSVAGVPVRIPSRAVRTLIVTLHAAQHGPGASKPLEDLGRAVDRLEDDVWAQAAAVAERLDATLTFATGIALAPGGGELAARIGVIQPDVAAAALGGSGPLVLGMHRLSSAHGMRAKVRILRRELFPSRAEMRWRAESDTGRGRSLPEAYVRRLLWLARNVPSSLAALRRGYAAGAGTRRPGGGAGSTGDGT